MPIGILEDSRVAMPVPSPRNKIQPARGNYADLSANLADIGEGELSMQSTKTLST